MSKDDLLNTITVALEMAKEAKLPEYLDENYQYVYLCGYYENMITNLLEIIKKGEHE